MAAPTSRTRSVLAAAAAAVSLLGASCAQEPDPAPPTTAAGVADPQPAPPTTTTHTPTTTQAPTTQAPPDDATTTAAPTTTEAPTTQAPPDDATTTTQAPTTTEAPTVSAAPTTTPEAPATTTEAPTTTQAPTTTEASTVSAAPTTTTEAPLPTTTTTEAPTPTTTEAPPPTTTEAPPSTTTEPPSPTTTQAPAVEAPYSAGRPAGDAPERGHPPTPTIGMIPRELPYWDHPNCASTLPVDLMCYPSSEWERPSDFEGCSSPSLDGRVCASSRPEEIPGPTLDTFRWVSWCYDQPSTPCRWLMFEMKWALDFLGAHPWCVLNEYTQRANIYASPQRPPRNIRDLYGWHRCATVIDPIVGTPDPGRSNDVGVLLSHSGISLAEQCRRVLPEDVQMESKVRRLSEEVQRFGSDCDAWAAWVDDRIGADAFRVCDRSARLAEEWMEHHYLIPERYFPVTC